MNGIYEGTVVELKKDGRRFLVTKVNPRKYRMTGTDGREGYTIDHVGVVRAENQTWEGPKPKTDYDRYLENRERGITLGVIVRFTSPSAARKFPGLYVVCTEPNANGLCRFARLGGAAGQYVTGGTEGVEVVDPADVLK